MPFASVSWRVSALAEDRHGSPKAFALHGPQVVSGQTFRFSLTLDQIMFLQLVDEASYEI